MTAEKFEDLGHVLGPTGRALMDEGPRVGWTELVDLIAKCEEICNYAGLRSDVREFQRRALVALVEYSQLRVSLIERPMLLNPESLWKRPESKDG